MKRNSPNTRAAVGEPSEQALSCATAEVITRKCGSLFPFAAFALFAGLLTGCAQFNTTQTDVSPERTITTKATAWTFLTSRSALANFKATQTDKTQSAAVGALTQESSTTNLAANADALTRLIHALRP